MSRYLFNGFKHCLYAEEKFQSDSERTLAVILDRESLKWFKPAKGQFQIYYKWGSENPEYQSDFVAETDTHVFMMEAKAKGDMNDPEVLAKRDVAVTCVHMQLLTQKHTKENLGNIFSFRIMPSLKI
jgi:type III restriction enzyme